MAAPLELCWRHICKTRSPWLTVFRTKTTKKESDFSSLIRKRYLQAKRSVVVRTQNPESTIKTLQRSDRLNSAFFTSNEQGYVLAEYKDIVGVHRLLETTTFFSTTTQFPVYSRCVFDISSAGRQISHRRGESLRIGHCPNRSHGEYPVLGSLERELEHLHSQRSLTDIDIRLRFMMCVILEDALKTLAPNIRIVPFGSCLNGSGWWDSDLDMMVCLHNDPFHMISTERQDSNMKFLSEVFLSERNLAHRTLTMMAALLELMPRTSKVQKILHARVPIIRFKNVPLNLECDISFQAVDSIRMTELLYLLSEYEGRLKLLMTAIKEWAVGHDLTSSGERQKPTTLGLLFLLIFYLQTRSPPVLPTLRQIQSIAGISNTFEIEGVRYQLPTSPKFIPPSMNTESVAGLLHGFFKFVSTFDFETQGVSITEGCAFPKTGDMSPLLVENPLCIGLNICKNVNLNGVNNLQEAMAEAAVALDKLNNEDTSQISFLSSFISQAPSNDNVNIEIESILSGFDDSEESKTQAAD